MNIDIPEDVLSKHMKELGWIPPKFDYPLIMRHKVTGVVVEFTALRVGTVLDAVQAHGWKVGELYSYWLRHTDTAIWEPCERPDPHKEFRDHVANGGEVDYFNKATNGWLPMNKDKFIYPKARYRCVPIPTGGDLEHKVCWAGNSSRAEAVFQGVLVKVLEYRGDRKQSYRTRFGSFAYAWPLTKTEIDAMT